MTYQEAGKRGGITTLERHGLEHFKKLGQYGHLARHNKLPLISELRQQKEIKEDRLPTSLQELKLAYRRKLAGAI